MPASKMKKMALLVRSCWYVRWCMINECCLVILWTNIFQRKLATTLLYIFLCITLVASVKINIQSDQQCFYTFDPKCWRPYLCNCVDSKSVQFISIMKDDNEKWHCRFPHWNIQNLSSHYFASIVRVEMTKGESFYFFCKLPKFIKYLGADRLKWI